MVEKPLYGLILAGGQSVRMGRDKAALFYQGERQLHRTFNLISSFVEEAYISVREIPKEGDIRSSFPYIMDLPHEMGGRGPSSGILAAYKAYPQRSWLVLACDLPLLTQKSLEHLISFWQKTRIADEDWEAWAYQSPYDGKSEPLCAIWSPKMMRRLEGVMKEGKSCPRSALKRGKTYLIEADDTSILENINTEEERKQILKSYFFE